MQNKDLQLHCRASICLSVQTVTHNLCRPPVTENTALAYSTLKGFQTLPCISALSTSFPAGPGVSKAHECTYGMKNESPKL